MSTKTLTATVTASIDYKVTKPDSGNSDWVPQENEVIKNQESYTTGDTDNKAELLYRRYVSVGAGANVDLDLYGTLTDVFGDTLNMEQVRTILCRNLSSTSGQDIRIGGQSVANAFLGPWNDTAAYITVKPSGCFMVDAPIDGYDVETDEQVIRINNPGASAVIVEVVVMATEGDLEESSSSSSSSSSQSSSSSSSQSSSSSSSQSSSSSSSSSP